MKRGSFGIILLALVCVTLGVGCGEVFFGLFKKTVPPIALGEFQTSAAHGYFLMYGVALGVLIFAIAILTAAVAPIFRTTSPKP